jgi:hypothetical protein
LAYEERQRVYGVPMVRLPRIVRQCRCCRMRLGEGHALFGYCGRCMAEQARFDLDEAEAAAADEESA